MTFARLLNPTQRSGSSTTHVDLTVIFLPQIPNGSVWVRESLRDEGVLTSLHEATFEARWSQALPHPLQLMRDNSFLADAEKTHLDENGIVRPGTTVTAGDVLWSAVETQSQRFKQKSKTKKSKSRSTPQNPIIQKDCSERVPSGWEGATVVQAEYEPSKNDIAVSVTIQLEQAVGVGDALFCEDSFLGVVSRFVEEEAAVRLCEEADLFVSAMVAEEWDSPIGSPVSLSIAKSQATAGQQVKSRRDGPYSLITRQPLNRDQLNPAQKITSAHARWLLSRGMAHLLAEFASLKCDDLEARTALTDFAEGKIDREQISAPGVPLSRGLLEAEFFAMGLKLERGSVPASEFRLRPATRDEILSTSQGQVKKPETLNYRTYEGEPNGLFCPTIFGEDVTRFGHVELAVPIVPFWLHHKASALAELLSVSAEQLQLLLDHRVGIQPSQGGLIWSDEGSLPHDADDWLIGADAVRKLLEDLPPDRMPPGWQHARDFLVLDVLPVLPTPLRPIILLDSGNFATSDLNDLYRRVINRNNRIAKLIELQAPPVILQNERRMLQYAVDALFANGFLPKAQRVLGENQRPLKSLMDLALSRFVGPINKPVVWSAQARGIVEDDLVSERVEIPQHLFEDLRLSTEQPVLITHEDTEVFVAFSPQPGSDAVIRLPQSAAKTLGLPFVTDRFLSIHAPLGTEAIAEAKRLLKNPPTAERRPAQSDPETPIEKMMPQLIQAVWQAESVPLDPGKAALLFGFADRCLI